MGVFDFLKAPTFSHPRFGEMRFSRDYWRGKAEYMGWQDVGILLRGNRHGIDPAAQALCDELEARFDSMKDEIAKALYEESYIPCSQAVDRGEYPEYALEEFPTIESAADIFNHLRPKWIMFEADGEPGYIMIGIAAFWEIEHTLGVGIKDWRFDYLNGSVVPY